MLAFILLAFAHGQYWQLYAGTAVYGIGGYAHYGANKAAIIHYTHYLVRIPDGAGAYRGIRANMEQTSAGIGLDHHSREYLGDNGNGIGLSHGIMREP